MTSGLISLSVRRDRTSHEVSMAGLGARSFNCNIWDTILPCMLVNAILLSTMRNLGHIGSHRRVLLEERLVARAAEKAFLSTHPGLTFLFFKHVFNMQLMHSMESSLGLPHTEQRWIVPLFVRTFEAYLVRIGDRV